MAHSKTPGHAGGSKKPPRHLYRYRSCTKRELDMLRRGVVFFSSPLRFNDPFDCALKLDPRFTSKQEALAAYNKVAQDSGAPLATLNDVDRDDFGKWLTTGSEEVSAQNLTGLGVCCFSAPKSDLPMWAHYGDEHKGFCLEFDTHVWPGTTLLQKVRYRKSVPFPRAAQAIIRGNQDAMLRLITVKSSVWESEAEWRAIRKGEGECEYPQDALTGIVFGLRMEDNDKQLVRALLSDSTGVRFYQAEKYSGRFGLKILRA